MRQAALLYHMFSTMIVLPCHSAKEIGLTEHELKPPIVNQNKPFLFLSPLLQVYCYNSRELTNTIPAECN
jgi:hypothetical protein